MSAFRLPRLAARNVRRNRRRSLITLLAIGVGVSMITTMRGFADGMHTLMIQDVVEGRTGAMQVHRKGYLASLESDPTQLAMPYNPALVEKIRQVPGVKAVAPRIQFNGLVSNGVSQTMFVGRGLDVSVEKAVCPRSGMEVKAGGAALTKDDTNTALLGYELAKSFHAEPKAVKDKALAEGVEEAAQWVDQVTVQSASPEGRANAVDMTVKGLTATSFPFENKRVMTLPLATAQSLLAMEGRVTEYAVAVEQLDELEQVAAALRQELGEEYEVHTWGELQPFVRDVIERQSMILGMIAVVLFIIVLTGIVNTMLMSVFERIREIGTMMAVGVRRWQILALFVMEAGLLGLLGGLVGAAAGRGFLAVVSLRGIPLKLSGTSLEAMLRPAVSTQFIVVAVLLALGGALLAAIYPAWRASRLRPVEALRSL